MADRVSEILLPIDGSSVGWCYEQGGREGCGYDSYQDAKDAYDNSRETSGAIAKGFRSMRKY